MKIFVIILEDSRTPPYCQYEGSLTPEEVEGIIRQIVLQRAVNKRIQESGSKAEPVPIDNPLHPQNQPQHDT